jgi:short-subunit dehydrogenase
MERLFGVVTGASTGIGLELARQFAENNYDLIICASSDEIYNAQRELEVLGGRVEVVKTDLATSEGVEKLSRAIKGYGAPLDAIAINAGVGLGGAFTETNLRDEINIINLNVLSTVHLTKCILKDMVPTGHGRILLTSSISAVMPSSFEAVYGASKAFISSFGEAIRNEVKDTGVTITMLMPGPTNTNFFHRAKMDDTKVGSKDKFENDPVDVARQGFEAMMRGDESVFSASWKTKIQGWATKIIPERTKAEIHRKMSEPNSAH